MMQQAKIESKLTTLPNLLDFSDYRQFLLAHFNFNKTTHHNYSLINFAKDLGVSYSNLKMIIKGKRNLTIENTFSVANGLRLSNQEKILFEALVFKSQAKSKEQLKYYEEKLDETAESFRTDLKHFANKDLLSKWFFPALVLYIIDVLQPKKLEFNRELFAILSTKFPINAEDFKVLEQIFLNPEIASLSPDGKMILSFKKLNLTLDQEQYLKQIAEMHSKSIRKNYNHTMAISIQTTKLKEFKLEYLKLLQKYVAMDLDPTDNTIAQITLQIRDF